MDSLIEVYELRKVMQWFILLQKGPLCMFDSVVTEFDPLPSSPEVWTGNYSGIEVAGSRVNGNEHLSAVSRYQVTWLKVTADNLVWVQDEGSSEQDGGNKTDATMLITSLVLTLRVLVLHIGSNIR